MTQKEAYEILGISPDAPPSDIKSAYRKQVKVYHPDKNPASNAGFIFRLIQDAWECLQDELEAKEIEAAKVKYEETRQADFKIGIEKLRRLYEEAISREQPRWDAEQRAYKAYEAYTGKGAPPVVELQGPREHSDGDFYYGIDDLRCNRSYRKVVAGGQEAFICQSESEADEVLIDGLNCAIQLYPISLERIVLLRNDRKSTYRDGIYEYIKTRQVVNGKLRDVYVHLQFKIKDTHGGVFPDLIHGVNAIVLERDEQKVMVSGHFNYIKTLNTCPAPKWVYGERPQSLPEGLPRVAFRISRYRDVTPERTVDNFPFIYQPVIEMPNPQELIPHQTTNLCHWDNGWRAPWEKKSLVWPDGVRRDTFRRLYKECDGNPPRHVAPLTLTGNPLEASLDGKYPDLVDGVNCQVKFFD